MTWCCGARDSDKFAESGLGRLLLRGRAFWGAGVGNRPDEVHEGADLIEPCSVAVKEFLEEELLLDAFGFVMNSFRKFQNHVSESLFQLGQCALATFSQRWNGL